MNWFFDNPVANMYGPRFLFFYGLVVTALILGCWLKLRFSDPTGQLHPIPLRRNPDPYEIAFLRGGENELIRLIIFNLIQRNYLKLTESKKWWGSSEQRIEKVKEHPDQRFLSTAERAVFSLFSSPQTASDIFKSDFPSVAVKSLVSDYEKKLNDEQALCCEEVTEMSRRLIMFGIMVILGLGGYKLLAALIKGRYNIGFLILIAICSVILLILFCRPPRLSRLGRDYLRRLQEVFERLKPSVSNASDTTLLLLVSVFGLNVLSDTYYSSLNQMFSKSSSGSGGCGGGCGGGSGCGGGGCGGGGCGGCGG